MLPGIDLTHRVVETLQVRGGFVLRRARACTGDDSVLFRECLDWQSGVDMLEHEYGIAAQLKATWALVPIGLTRYRDNLALLLADPGGRPLTLQKGEGLELSDFLQIAVQLAAALRGAHESDLIHRDISPDNIFCGGQGQILLAGFGLATRLSKGRQILTRSDPIEGALAYMAPEQTGRIGRSIDERSDLYSLGVTLYQLLTGALPFVGSTVSEWIHCHTSRRPTRPRVHRAGIPIQVESILLKLLSKEPAARYQTAEGLEADLRQSWRSWMATGEIEQFTLAMHDTPARPRLNWQPRRNLDGDQGVETGFEGVAIDGTSRARFEVSSAREDTDETAAMSPAKIGTDRLDIAAVAELNIVALSEATSDRVTVEFMRVAVESAGAVRGVLLLNRDEEMRIVAEAIVSSSNIEVFLEHEALINCRIPENIINEVKNGKNAAAIFGAPADPFYSQDKYFVDHKILSYLIIPIINKGIVAAIFYVENDLISGAFDDNRALILRILASQVVIALENTTLVSGFGRLQSELEDSRVSLRSMEGLTRQSFDAIPALAWAMYPDGAFEFANKRWHDYTGLPTTLPVDRPWTSPFHPDDVERVAETWRLCVETGMPRQVEGRMRRVDGEYHTFLIHTAPVRDETGAIVRWYGTNTYIDNLKRAEALISAENQILQMITEDHTLPEIFAVLVHNIEDLVQRSSVTLSWLDLSSHSIRHVAGARLPTSFVSALDRLRIDLSTVSVRTPGPRTDISIDPNRLDSTVWSRYRDLALAHGLTTSWSTPVISSNGSSLGNLTIYPLGPHQITEQEVKISDQFSHLTSIIIEKRRAQDALSRSEAILLEGQRISHTGSWEWNPTTDYLTWSEECARIFGYSPQEREIPFMSVLERVHPEDRGAIGKLRESWFRPTNVDYSNEQRLTLPDNSVRIVQVRGRSVQNEDGDPIRFVGTVIDVTEQRKYDDEMRRLVSLIENSTDCIGYARTPGKVEYLNVAWRKLAGLGVADDVSQYSISELLPTVGTGSFEENITPILLRDGHWEGEGLLRQIDRKNVIPVHQTIFFITDVLTGERTGIAAICRDITLQKRMNQNLKDSLVEKESLLKEVHHRVKNNLQLISSMLNLQAARIDDGAVSELFSESRNRVRSMALVHENLYRAGNFSKISMGEHIETLSASLARAYGLTTRRVDLVTKVQDISLDLDRAISLGLIINELVSNALKHAFPNGRAGRVSVELGRLPGNSCFLSVGDNGVGLPTEIDPDNSSSMGLQLVHDLTNQLHGEMAVVRGPGTTFKISFLLEDALGASQ